MKTNSLTPKISVIIPVYNTEKYIEKCLESVISQPIKDIEIIVTDNGCTDNSSKIIEKFAQGDNRIKVIRCEHSEAFHARNLALEQASGKWIAFCDSDDTLTEDAFSKALAVGEKYNCDIVTASFNELNDSGEMRTISIDLKPANSFMHIFSTPCIWNKLIKRSFLIQNNLCFPDLIIGEDVLFLGMALACAPKMKTADVVMYNYWHHDKAVTPSMNHRYGMEYFDMHMLCRKKLSDCLKNTEHERQCEEYIHFDMVFFLIVFLRKMSDYSQRQAAFEIFRKHILDFDWTNYRGRFLSVFGINIEQFININCDDFLYNGRIIPPRDIVLDEYKNGLIGLSYILKYFKAWMIRKFKIGL